MVKNWSGYLMAIFMVGLIACKEETRVNQIEGRIYSDCENSISGREVAFKANPTGAFKETVILASDITNDVGYFRFSYELEEDKSGSADLILVGQDGYSEIITNVPLNRDLQLSGYQRNESVLTFSLTGPKIFQPTDTLFYGMQNSTETFWVQPDSSAMDTLRVKANNRYGAQPWLAFYYGVGKTEFDLAKEALSIKDSSYNHIYFQISGCPQTETFNLYIE